MCVASYEHYSSVRCRKEFELQRVSLIIHIPHFIPFPGFWLYGSFLIKDDIPIPGPA